MSLHARTAFRRALYCFRYGVRRYCKESENDKPVKFSTSEAAKWRAATSRSGNLYDDDTPDAQAFIVSLSTGAFLVYFLYLREESDLDEIFNIERSIYDRVPDLEEVNLKVLRDRMKKNGEDVREIDKRIQELEAMRLNKTPAISRAQN